jgi:hypothetical protein
VARLAFGAITLLLVAATIRIVLVETPLGGRPLAEVAINTTHNANAVVGANAAPGVIAIGPEMDPEDVDAALVGIEAGPSMGVAAEDGILDAYGTRAALVEETEFGALPRISASGETPFAAYARPSVGQSAAGGAARIAIVVTGLGINLSGSLEAISKLPDTVTLAFAPYGRNLERSAGSARAEGHEIFIEVPLEPFDYPDNDPGPDTLLTGQAPRDNMQKLYRVLGKRGG